MIAADLAARCAWRWWRSTHAGRHLRDARAAHARNVLFEPARAAAVPAGGASEAIPEASSMDRAPRTSMLVAGPLIGAELFGRTACARRCSSTSPRS